MRFLEQHPPRLAGLSNVARIPAQLAIYLGEEHRSPYTGEGVQPLAASCSQENRESSVICDKETAGSMALGNPPERFFRQISQRKLGANTGPQNRSDPAGFGRRARVEGIWAPGAGSADIFVQDIFLSPPGGLAARTKPSAQFPAVFQPRAVSRGAMSSSPISGCLYQSYIADPIYQ